jgi:hypothetical protein
MGRFMLMVRHRIATLPVMMWHRTNLVQQVKPKAETILAEAPLTIRLQSMRGVAVRPLDPRSSYSIASPHRPWKCHIVARPRNQRLHAQ